MTERSKAEPKSKKRKGAPSAGPDLSLLVPTLYDTAVHDAVNGKGPYKKEDLVMAPHCPATIIHAIAKAGRSSPSSDILYITTVLSTKVSITESDLLEAVQKLNDTVSGVVTAGNTLPADFMANYKVCLHLLSLRYSYLSTRSGDLSIALTEAVRTAVCQYLSLGLVSSDSDDAISGAMGHFTLYTKNDAIATAKMITQVLDLLHAWTESHSKKNKKRSPKSKAAPLAAVPVSNPNHMKMLMNVFSTLLLNTPLPDSPTIEEYMSIVLATKSVTSLLHSTSQLLAELKRINTRVSALQFPAHFRQWLINTVEGGSHHSYGSISRKFDAIIDASEGVDGTRKILDNETLSVDEMKELVVIVPLASSKEEESEGEGEEEGGDDDGDVADSDAPLFFIDSSGDRKRQASRALLGSGDDLTHQLADTIADHDHGGVEGGEGDDDEEEEEEDAVYEDDE